MITGIILAGGQGSRMGGLDKGLLLLDGLPLYQHVLTRLVPQVDKLYINANRHIPRYQESGFPVFSDVPNASSGPLAGIFSGLTTITSDWMVFVPCDAPNLPLDLVERLWQGKRDHLAAFANDGQRDHPTLLLIHRSLAPTLQRYLDAGDRKLMLFLATIDAIAVSFADQPLAFQNLNTPDDLSHWQASSDD